MSISNNIVTSSEEVLLYGTRFPIFGTVRRTAATPFPPKITIGNYSRDDSITKSAQVMDNFSGGAGILYANPTRDADRFWYSTLQTIHKHLGLNPLVTQAGTLVGPADQIIEYDERLYVVVGAQVHRWNESTRDWTLLATLSGLVTGVEVFTPPLASNAYLYFLTPSGMHRYDGTTGTWAHYMSGEVVPNGHALVEWDGKLFRLGMDNRMYWSINPTSTAADWTEAGALHLPPGHCRQLIVYFDLAGEAAIHAVTRTGVFGYEFTSRKFHPTPLIYPATATAGQGAVVWRGELYVPAGAMVYKYNGSTIQAISPTRDDGLPSTLRGDISHLIAGHSFLYAVISTVAQGDPVDFSGMFSTGNPLETHLLSVAAMHGAVMQTQGGAWHGTFDSEAGSQMGAGLVATIESTHRLWMSSGSGIFYIDLPTSLHNPLQNPTAQFRESGYLETGWNDLGWAEMDKLALTMEVHADRCSSTERIHIYVAWDENDEWQHLGTVDSSGHHSFLIGGDGGRVFKSSRFRFEMERGPDVHKTPVLRAAILTFVRRPELEWGWSLSLNLAFSGTHAGKTSEQLIERLYEITEDIKTAGRFAYRDETTGQLRNHRVLISNIEGAEIGGLNVKGRYTISLIQLDDVLDG
jgi:hypothetical protein